MLARVLLIVSLVVSLVVREESESSFSSLFFSSTVLNKNAATKTKTKYFQELIIVKMSLYQMASLADIPKGF